ncbi:MAG: DUF5343 domain-containing protein [Betaproteobacteria bacterium]|nr:DUF5343 domain-containing protein [Betaproteobacteria bacterium]
MTAEYPPFMFGYGMIATAIAKIQDHDIPETFNHEYLRYTLGFSRESDRAFIPLLKRIGFLTAEGKPTALYTQLHKPKQSAAAIAQAMQQGFSALYAVNAKAHELERKELAALVVELTKLEAGHTTARAIVGTFLTLKEHAYPAPPAADDRRKTPERRKTTA